MTDKTNDTTVYVSKPEGSVTAPLTRYWRSVRLGCSPGTWKVISCVRDNPNHVIRHWMIPYSGPGQVSETYVVFDVVRDLAILRVQKSTFKALQSRSLLFSAKGGHGSAGVTYKDYRIAEPGNQDRDFKVGPLIREALKSETLRGPDLTDGNGDRL